MRPVPRVWLAATCIAAVLFAVSARVLLRTLPAPLTPFDYMIVGTFATCISLLAFFLFLAWRTRTAFFKRRPR